MLLFNKFMNTGKLIPKQETQMRVLTTEQLKDLGHSGISLLDIDPNDGASSIMEGLTRYEYGMAIVYRKAYQADRELWHNRLSLMAQMQLDKNE